MTEQTQVTAGDFTKTGTLDTTCTRETDRLKETHGHEDTFIKLNFFTRQDLSPVVESNVSVNSRSGLTVLLSSYAGIRLHDFFAFDDGHRVTAITSCRVLVG